MMSINIIDDKLIILPMFCAAGCSEESFATFAERLKIISLFH